MTQDDSRQLIEELERLKRSAEEAIRIHDFNAAAEYRDESRRIEREIASNDEDEALCQYIWKHYKHLMSPLEQRAALTNNGVYPPGSAEDLKAIRLFGPVDLDELTAALQDGEHAFRTRTAQRVLKEHSETIVINRCPKCNRVARTPQAKQCRHCGYDWH